MPAPASTAVTPARPAEAPDRLAAAPFIPRHVVDAVDAASFPGLRREGIRLVQDLSGERWTDYNLHDPGVTMLEALCYGLTELAYRAEAPLEQQLQGSALTMSPERLGMPLPERALPCRASTDEDLRAWLLDRVPGLADVALQALPSRGLLQLRLRLAPDLGPPAGTGAGTDPRLEAQRACLRAVREAYAGVRTLGEDLDEQVIVVDDRPCTLMAHLEIGGSREPAAVLAEVYHACALYIGAVVPRVSTAGLLSAGELPESVYSGPLLQRRAAGGPGLGQRQARLYASDLAAIVRDIDGVRQVRELTLDGRRSLPWFDDQSALRLRVPGHDFPRSEVQLTRRGSVVEVDAAQLLKEFEDITAQPADPGAGGASAPPALPPTPQEPSSGRDGPHVSVQQHLPPIYGLGEAGLPAEAGLTERVRARQLSGYLALFDQLLAHGQAQLAHLRDLHDVDAWRGPSYWWQVLGDASVPGLESTYLDAEGKPSPERAKRLPGELTAAFDQRSERFQRALDATLALQGHGYPQNTLRQFLGHLDALEQENFLLRNKAAYLQWVLDHGADRAAAADLSRAGVGSAANASGLQRCAQLLLGFEGPLATSLLGAHRPPELQIVEDEAGAAGLGRIDRRDSAALAQARPVGRAARPQPARSLAWQRLPAAVLRAGADRQRYRWWPDDAASADPAAPGQLVLGPDESGHWWRLGRCRQETAAEATDGVRRWLLALNSASEGMHVIEHVLLRQRGPAGAADPDAVDEQRLALRVTVVFPGWTVRTRQPAFREFADETLQIVAPAHTAVRCLWIDAAAMADLESALAPWLQALRAQTLEPAEAPADLDAAAREVVRQLRRHSPGDWL